MNILEKLQFGVGQKLPVMLQTEASECGLTCLTMIAGFHGYEIDLARLRQKFSVSLKGTTLANLIDIATGMELSSRALRLEIDEMSELQMPCILHWDFNHFVVLKQVSRHYIVVHDPAYGERRMRMDEVSKHFTGVALELMPTPQFEKKEDKQHIRWRQLIGKTIGLKRSLFQIFLLAITLEILALTGPFLNQWVIDHVLVTADRSLMTVLGIGFLLLAFVRIAISTLRSWVLMMMSTTINVQWLSNVFSHLTRLPISWFEKRHIGDITSRFGSVQQIQSTLTTSFVEIFLDGIMAIGAFIVLLFYNALLTAIVCASLIIYALLRWAWYLPLRQSTETHIVKAATEQSYFLETLRGIRSIRIFNATADRRTRWLNLMVEEKNAGLRTQKLGIVFQSTNGLLLAIEGVAVLWLAALSVMDGYMTVGMLFAFLSFKDQFASRTSQLINKWLEFRMLRLQAERLADIVLTEPEDETPAQARAIKDVEPSISLRQVDFRYGDNEPLVIKKCDLTITAGEVVALVGASGCGKTTLLKLMLGIHQPNEGEILIGNMNLAHIRPADYRDMIGVVMQDDQLFAGSIADNISFFDLSPEQARIEACAKLASIHPDITAMPMGYNTLIGDMGGAISGGQKQRILLARALYKQPKILFLDEATSHLDINNEWQVNQAIRQLSLTRIIVAHRPETIRMANRIVLIDAGQAHEISREEYEALQPRLTN
jgi:ATP-binding cassette subfamily B protein RaxB